MRAFTAIDLNQEVRAGFNSIQDSLKTFKADIRWVKPENAHLTLKFLGEIQETESETIKTILDEVAAETEPFEISFSGLGFFPNSNHPRVIWIGIQKGVENLKVLTQSIDNRTATLGIPKEARGFSPHLTLGRFSTERGSNQLVTEVGRMHDTDSGSLFTEEIHLIKSVLLRSGPTYTKIYSARFARNG